MDYKKLADLLFPNVTITKEDLEQKYKTRGLPENAIVTRFAPSPTGFLHMGSVFTCLVADNFAKKSGGKFLLRIEDTDQTRKIDSAVKLIINGLKRYGINFDEGVDEEGNDYGDYGPYTQSERREIYQAMAKYLVSVGKAYPCFCTEEISSRDKQIQEVNKELIGYYGSYAHCRDLSFEEIENNIKQGMQFAIRLKCESNVANKIVLEDAIRGTLKVSDNFNDVILLKRDGLPPYNFAHVCDDHFMRVNLVIRGDEYIPSIAEHIQIFKACGFEPIKYAHVAPIQKMDGSSKRKISKRKDPEADVQFYITEGYPVESVREYLYTVANSNFEEWRRTNSLLETDDFVISPEKMSISGALFDLPKLNDISKNVIAKFSADKVYDLALNWAVSYDKQLFTILNEQKEYSKLVFSIERGTAKPRKDIAKWNEVKETYSYFYNDLYNPQCEQDYNFDYSKFKKADLIEIINRYINVYEEETDKQIWFDKIKNLAVDIGFTNDMKIYKANPENFSGHYGDVATILRVAITTRTNTPDLFAICTLLKKEEIIRRLKKAVDFLSK